MRKRDSVEFLWDELKPFLPKSYTEEESIKILSILKQAKEMHKQEIIAAKDDNYVYGEAWEKLGTLGEQYYNETFGE